jgi:putative multicomponent Na+:H+ antiporter subunit B
MMLDFRPWLENLGEMDGITVAIAVLLPVSATMTVVQTNPYQALVMRGILGGVAALVYALLGAADVALTEALVGTMLSITLYAVAVRSSLTLRLGILSSPTDDPRLPEDIEQAILAAIAPHHLRLEIVPCPNPGETIAPNHAPQVVFDSSAMTLFTPIERLVEIFTASLPPDQLTVVLAPIDQNTQPQEVTP